VLLGLALTVRAIPLQCFCVLGLRVVAAPGIKGWPFLGCSGHSRPGVKWNRQALDNVHASNPGTRVVNLNGVTRL